MLLLNLLLIKSGAYIVFKHFFALFYMFDIVETQ
jgi:hypothetical protein